LCAGSLFEVFEKALGKTEMNLPRKEKEKLKEEIVAGLSEFPEVQRVIVFGSFVTSDDPNDLDIAVFQNSDESYYPLAMKYRRTLRSVAKRIPLDVIPICRSPVEDPFLKEIQRGELLYER
jgi:predicted nucleotidyltransferase